ncbi:MAG: DUF4097 family beta strand repeat protein [Candidatus Latescibacteria bacterium]|jgi:hypothetical protein|nr:DUF4097 family beta strand repeat protein [Candidatus Latescibacterota bacterium]
MKKFIQFSGVIVLMVMFSTNIHGENNNEDTMTMEFSDPSRPGLLKVSGGKGDVTINGYNGKEVIIKTILEIENLTSLPKHKKAKGLKRISGTKLNVAIVEDENTIVISRSLKDKIEMFIQVPFKTSLKSVGGIFEGNIEVKNISGEIEINTSVSSITLLDISGEAAVNTITGKIVVTFKDINREKPMYFSAVDGYIDVTFPPDTQANLTIKNVDGDVFTDFEIDLTSKPKVEKKKTSSGRANIRPGNNITGKINGGGPEIQLITVTGNIYVRKGE